MTRWRLRCRLVGLRVREQQVLAQLQDLVDLIDHVRARDLLPLEVEQAQLVEALHVSP